MRLFILCADDYGLAPGVCDAIEQLAEAGVVTATGAMTLMPTWKQRAAGLARVARQSGAEAGLHLTLTDQPPLESLPLLASGGRLPSVGRLIRLAWQGQLSAGSPAGQEIIREISAQWEAFCQAYGAPPAFVDGHQHVHILPGIREAVLAEIARRASGIPGTPPCQLRSCGDSFPAILRRPAVGKALFLAGLNLGLPEQCRQAGLPCNDSFAGLHGFSPDIPYGSLFPRFLTGAGRFPLVHVHPGIVDSLLQSIDPLTTPREGELAYLRSGRFTEDCARAGMAPASPSRVFAGSREGGESRSPGTGQKRGGA